MKTFISILIGNQVLFTNWFHWGFQTHTFIFFITTFSTFLPCWAQQLSTHRLISAGVPRGSNIGPIPFNLYTDEFPQTFLACERHYNPTQSPKRQLLPQTNIKVFRLDGALMRNRSILASLNRFEYQQFFTAPFFLFYFPLKFILKLLQSVRECMNEVTKVLCVTKITLNVWKNFFLCQ